MERRIEITSEDHKYKLLNLIHDSVENWVSGLIDAEYQKLIKMEKDTYIQERMENSQPIHIESDEQFVNELISSREFSTAKDLTEDFNTRHSA